MATAEHAVTTQFNPSALLGTRETVKCSPVKSFKTLLCRPTRQNYIKTNIPLFAVVYHCYSRPDKESASTAMPFTTVNDVHLHHQIAVS